MSLFLGNLAPHIRREELERVFRRFGRSNVNLKDGYGFVVYDLPANAEKALRALRGKNICGEPITLTWSNKQPRHFQRFKKGSRFYEPYNRRNFTRSEDYGMRKMSSRDRRELKMAAKHLDSKGGGPHMDDLFVKETDSHHDNIGDCEGEKHQNSKNGLMDEAVSVKQNSTENDRWGEPASDPMNNNGMENGVEFERYEPYHGYERRDEDENHQMTSSYGSPQGSSQVKARRERTSDTALKKPDQPKPHQSCYICGLIGHRMRNCPQADAYRGEKLSQFGSRRDKDDSFRGRGEGGLKRLRPTSLGRPYSSGDHLPRQQKSKRKASGSGKPETLVRRNECSPIRKENCWYELRRDSRRKKKSMREQRSPKKYRGWKAKRPASSAPSSDSTASRSRSHSRSSGTSSHSRSGSLSSRTRSVSSSSRSTSTSSYSRSDSSRSRSKSSSPTSLSLSVSLGQPLPSSPNKAQMEAAVTYPKGYLENDIIPKSKHLLIKQRQPVQGDASSENSKPKVTSVTLKDQNTLPSFKIEVGMNKDHFGQWEDDGNRSTSKIQYEVKSPCMSPSEKCIVAAENSPTENSRVRMYLEKSGPMAMEQTQTPFGKPNPEVPASSQLKSSTSTSPSEKCTVAADNSPIENSRERMDLLKSGPMAMEQTQKPFRKPNPKVPASSQLKNSASISTQEMYMVLKHYGLDGPEENADHLPVEAHFGSARLWPWEIIYYRRLKKGPISTENYARRVAQNREFGIVDKYIRSSSGWAECDQSNS